MIRKERPDSLQALSLTSTVTDSFLAGWGVGIRTPINGTKIRGPAIRRRPTEGKVGWGAGTRTPINGTRIRGPAVRRHPNKRKEDCIKPPVGLSTLLDLEFNFDVAFARLPLHLHDGKPAQTFGVHLVPGFGAARFARRRAV